MSKTILVPLDGSEVAEAALANIEDLALCTSSGIKRKIVLLQVVSNITYNVLTTDEIAQIPINRKTCSRLKVRHSLTWKNRPNGSGQKV